jgi:hypothetical protein
MVRGATYEIEITITDDLGAAIDLTLASGILVGAYNDNKRVFAKWSLVAKDGYGDVTVVDAVGGIISVALQVDDSLKSLEKNARVEVVVSFPNPTFNGSLQVSIDTDIELEIVERSIFEGITSI